MLLVHAGVGKNTKTVMVDKYHTIIKKGLCYNPFPSFLESSNCFYIYSFFSFLASIDLYYDLPDYVIQAGDMWFGVG